MRTLSLALLFLLPPCLPAAPARFELKDGDRVVFLGNTLIEREQRYAWWELMLTARNPGKKITFRNLGWSGDTVFGHARAGFDSVADGFKRLREQTLGLNPTVIFVAYGTNEAFDGPAGLPAFRKGLETLLDALAPAKARIVLLGPPRQGTMPAPFPSPDATNANLRAYADAIRDIAAKRDLLHVDLYDLLGDIGQVKPAVTQNGLHLTGEGYRWSATRLEQALGLEPVPHALTLDVRQKSVSAVGGRATWQGDGIRCQWTPDRLSVQPTRLRVLGLPAGQHALSIDGQQVLTASAEQWARGEVLPTDATIEKLAELIRAKNELYFHRWRPQNTTYLYGFRKHEQGKNAAEIPRFDPLIEAKEKEIAKLAIPAPRVVTLAPASK